MKRFIRWLTRMRPGMKRRVETRTPSKHESDLQEARSALAASHQRADQELERVTLQQQHWFEESLLQPQIRPRRRVDWGPSR